MATATASPPEPLLTLRELCSVLKVGEYLIKDRIRRYPPGSENAFPVEYFGRWRRFDAAHVRAWFAAEARGFVPAPAAATPAAA